MNDLRLLCLNLVGLCKPNKIELMQSVDEFIKSQGAKYDACKLAGQIMRLYQKWPISTAHTNDRAWCAQLLVEDPDGVKNKIHVGEHRRVSYDGYRVHIVKKNTRYEGIYEKFPFDLDAICVVDDSDYTALIGLFSFENVETGVVSYEGRNYVEQYILEAFAGSDTMSTTSEATTNLHLRSVDGRRTAVIAPLRS